MKRINVKLGWFLTTRATTALMGPATESRRAVVRFGSRLLAIRKHLQQDDLRIHLHLNCRQWYLELLRYRSLPVASFPPYRWEESRALKDNESYTQIWEEYNGVPDDNNNRSARCKLGGSDSLNMEGTAMALALWAGVIYICYTALMSLNKDETAVRGCNPPVLVLVVWVSCKVYFSRSTISLAVLFVSPQSVLLYTLF